MDTAHLAGTIGDVWAATDGGGRRMWGEGHNSNRVRTLPATHLHKMRLKGDLKGAEGVKRSR